MLIMATKVQHQLEPWSHLAGKIVMVTGASSGLGYDFCLDLARAGCRVMAAARRVDRLKSLCDQINNTDVPTGGASNGGFRQAIAVVLDVTADGATIKACVEKAWDAGRIDALVNNAGVRGQKMLSLEFPEEEFNHVLNTNSRGSWLVAKYVGAWMRDSGRGGSIINISSASGLNRAQSHGSIVYGPSKAALDSMTRVIYSY